MQDFLKINDNDNVVVALNTIPAGEKITVSVGDGQKTVTAREEIPAGHKMAIFDIPEGGEVIKYGYRIGNAKENITEGSWIHTHNVKTALGDLLEYTYNPTPVEEKKTEDVTFMGFNRPDGKVGVRNEIWVIPTVGCVNNVATAIAKQANAFVKGSVEEVIAFPHPYGCSQMGDDQEHTRKILADLINHPNAGGVLVLGLGCENSNIDVLKPYIGDYDENRVKFLVCQEHEDEIADSVEVIKGLIDYASKFEREPISVSKLVIGMKCGGSDGLSGITANPLVGRFSDLLISKGGTTILTEVPEMFGAETILMNRCANEELFHQTVDLINDFKNYFKSHNQTIYENPSPGNKKGGISTLEDKSLGCTQKSGSALVKGVLQYGDTVKTPGLNRVKFLVCQEHEDEIADSVEVIKGLIDYASKFEREPISVSKLVIGMKCGGSDGLSGITANPLVGRFSDLLISKGGTTILTEVPEMFGAETILMNRCANEELFHQTVDLINDFKNYFKSHNQTIYENPSPGNKKGGISTLEDKSLGCTQKSGSALVKGVLQYGDTVKTPGLNLLSAPGNDLVAATALAAAGAHIVLFTTGRGTPFASPVPTMKIATNSRLAGKKSNWIDFNAGVLVEDKTMEEETKALFDLVVETASGKQVCSEAAGFHDMAIFKQGVTL